LDRKATSGADSVMTTVVADGVAISLIPLRRKPAASESLSPKAFARSSENLAAAASMSVPSWNFTPVRSWKV